MNTDSMADIPSFGGGLGWYYGWNLEALSNTEGLEFVPMVWGADAARQFDGAVPAATNYILGFNEREFFSRYIGCKF